MAEGPIPILYISHHADIVGGGEISLLHLAGRLDRGRWAPMMVLPGHGEMTRRCKRLDIPTFILPMPSCRWFTRTMRASVTRLREMIRVTDAAVLHANGSRAMMYAGLAARLEGRRVVWHVRVPESDRLGDRLLARLAHRIVVNSEAVGRRFPYVASSRLLCVYNGIDLDDYHASSGDVTETMRARLGVPMHAPLVMSIGRFTAEKGYGHLLEAAHRLATTHPELHWVLVGDGEQRAELEARSTALGIDDRIHFPGWVSDIPSVLAVCDVFVLPSLREGFGRVLIEAMAMGKAVVATNTGGVPEVVVPGETGILVSPGNADALAQGVRGLIANPNLAMFFGRNGRHRVEHRFNLSQHVQAVSGLYEALVA